MEGKPEKIFCGYSKILIQVLNKVKCYSCHHSMDHILVYATQLLNISTGIECSRRA